ncbi:MAG: hypothetical protein QOC61_1285 [Acidobacteriota bacterium]|nr:hypothetical protein [Acidobacteriota bacterium]
MSSDSKPARSDVESFRKFLLTEFGNMQKGGSTSFSKFGRDASGDIKEVERVSKSSFGHIVQEAKSAASSMAGSFLGGLSSVAGGVASVFGGNLLMSAVSKLGSGLKSEITTAFDFNDLKERSLIGFTTLFKNAGLSAEEAADKAKRHLQDLIDFGAKTPFRSQQLIELSQQLQAVGFKAEEVIPTLTSVGDAVAGLGGDPEKLQRLITNLGQIKTTGQVSSREIRELAMAGIPAWKYLADYSGKSVEQVRKLAEKNMLDADVAVKVILSGMSKNFGGMMKQTEGTYSSMWSTIEDLNQMRAADAFKPAFEEVKKGQAAAILGLESGAAEGFTKSAAGLQQVILGGFDKMLAGIASGDFKQLGFGALDAVVTGATDGAKGLYDAGANAGAQLEKGWRDALDQHSPSEVMRRLGFDAALSGVEGFNQGMRSGGGLGSRWAQEQIEFAKKILEVAREVGATEKQIEAAFAAANVESRFRPGAVGDQGRAHGAFQMWPSKGWGTVEQVTNPDYAIRKFFEVAQSRSQAGTPGQLAQRVEGSAYPRRYDEQIGSALELLNLVRGGAAGEFKSAVSDFDAAVRDLAASTNWRARGDHSPDEGRVRFGDLSEEQQFEVVKRLPGFREWMQKTYGQSDHIPGSRDLQGGTGVFAKPAPLPATVPTIKSIDASKYLKPSAIDESSLLSGAKGATQAHYELLKAIAQVGDTAEKNFNKAGKAEASYGSLTKKTVGILGDLKAAHDELKQETDFKASELAANTLGETFRNLKTNMLDSVDAIIFSGQSLKQALTEALRQTVVQTASYLGKKAMLKGLDETAEGFSDLANPFMAWHAPTHFYAAAGWFALAAAAGIGGRLIAGAGRGSGGSGSAGSGASTSQTEPTPQNRTFNYGSASYATPASSAMSDGSRAGGGIGAMIDRLDKLARAVIENGQQHTGLIVSSNLQVARAVSMWEPASANDILQRATDTWQGQEIIGTAFSRRFRSDNDLRNLIARDANGVY